MKELNKNLGRLLSNVFLLVILVLTSNVLFSQNLKENNESPYFYVKSRVESIDMMPLKSTKVNVEISGVIANVHISQVYTNESENAIEAIYVSTNPVGQNSRSLSLTMLELHRDAIMYIIAYWHIYICFDFSANEKLVACTVQQWRYESLQLRFKNKSRKFFNWMSGW